MASTSWRFNPISNPSPAADLGGQRHQLADQLRLVFELERRDKHGCQSGQVGQALILFEPADLRDALAHGQRQVALGKLRALA